MRYEIRQTATGWELVNLSTGDVVASTTVGPEGSSSDAQHAGYAAMARELGDRMSAELATDPADPATASTDDGLLPEVWESDQGIAFSELLPGGRDFSSVAWTWRDPGSGPLVPLMLQTQNDYGHLGSQLAGYVESFSLSDGTVGATGRFFDNEAGQQFRDLLLGGRSFGVSVDPTERLDITFECDQMDDYGWCEEERTVFNAYEIGGLTGCPFPGFENAGIRLAGAAGAVAGSGRHVREAIAAALTAAGGKAVAPVRPPRSWFFVDPPMSDDDPRLVLQPADELGVERLAVPLTITDDGQVFGNMAVGEGACHVGYAGDCVTVPTSPTNYARFHLGATPCDDGSVVPTGVLVAGADHAPLTLNGDQLRNRHEATSLQWADVRAVDTPYGPWVCGALRPDVTEHLLRALRGSSVSGEWRDEGRGLDLILAVSVSSPGWPVFREALVASSLGSQVVRLPAPQTRVRYHDGRVVALSAGVPVAQAGHQGCRSCGDGPLSRSRRPHNDHALAQLMAVVQVIEQRTRHLTAPAVEAALARIAGADRATQ